MQNQRILIVFLLLFNVSDPNASFNCSYDELFLPFHYHYINL